MFAGRFYNEKGHYMVIEELFKKNPAIKSDNSGFDRLRKANYLKVEIRFNSTK